MSFKAARKSEDKLQDTNFSGFPMNQPVLHPGLRITDGPTPVFGDSVWDLSAMGLPPSKPSSTAVIRFEKLPISWQETAKALFMAQLNPVDEVLLECGIYFPQRPPKIATLVHRLNALKSLAKWSVETGRTEDLSRWSTDDLREFLIYVDRNNAPTAYLQAERILGLLVQYSPAMPYALNVKLPESRPSRPSIVSTEPIHPDDFWALLRACWAYIEVFGPELLDARDELNAREKKISEKPLIVDPNEILKNLDRWLSKDGAYIPLHCLTRTGQIEDRINWNGLNLLVDFNTGLSGPFPKEPRSRRYQMILSRIKSGLPVSYGLTEKAPSLIEVSGGELRPWVKGFDRGLIQRELTKIRSACMIFISALTTMRASEVLSLKKDCLTTYMGAPALRSVTLKHRAAIGEVSYWWITEPVVKAVMLAQRLSNGGELLFQPVKGTNYSSFRYDNDIRSFVKYVNSVSQERGLSPITDSRIRMHRLRRTMAVVTAAQPDGEIALGITLKHSATRALANSVTSGYGAPTKAWVEELGIERDMVAASELVSAWSRHDSGKLEILGPGQKRFKEGLDRVSSQVDSVPQRKNNRILREMLRDEFSGIILGPINHCLGDPSVARCLRGAENTSGPMRPILSQCEPSACSNSVILEEHLMIWRKEADELKDLLLDGRMSGVHRERLNDQLQKIEATIKGKNKAR